MTADDWKKAEMQLTPEKVKYKYYTPYFGSFRTLKAHFIKNNESITLVETLVDL